VKQILWTREPGLLGLYQIMALYDGEIVPWPDRNVNSLCGFGATRRNAHACINGDGMDGM
jgi:hypothetical protein